MQQLREIATVFESRGYSLTSSIFETMKKFKLKTLCHQSGIQKAQGFSTTEIITLLIMLPIMALKSVHQLYRSEYKNKAEMQKDALYRLKNNEHHSWRRLLYAVAKGFTKLVKPENESDESEKKKTAIVFDDTTDARVGYKMENISYIYDHVTKRTTYGYKTLAMGYFDGMTLRPLDFTVHTEKKLERKKAKKQYKKEVNPKSPGGKRRKEAKMTKIKAAVQMIKRAVKNGFTADYVLCDSWFTSEELISAVRKIKGGAMHIIAGVKNGNQKYGYNGSLFNAKEIIALLKKSSSPHRCRRLGINYYNAVVSYKNVGTVKLAMCRYPRQKKWRVFITTDTEIDFIEMMETYGIRWTIEVMFRECKQYLQLGACQSQDFDAQIASITITLILYTLLAYLKRMESYETLGELFLLTQQDVCEKNMAERLWALFEELLAFMIEAVSAHDSMDIKEFAQSKEYAFVKEIFESSFLVRQMNSVNKAA
ncbi:MAG: transposase [Clostridiales bacterium]|jgi:hypothetical protein|nr:transposase [Clostridiales bacterium]